jgi:RNA polymerase sigma factor (TIGR02999 family)
MADLTLLLGAIQRGEPDAAGALLAQVYAELRQLARARMARENPGHTLQATALVHEAWLRLGDQCFENRAHFFSAAAEAMRRILIESARRKLAVRHGGNLQRTGLDSINMPAAAPDKADDLLALDEALQELAATDARKARLVELRYFVGLEASEAAEVLGISKATADRDWAYARAWLHERIRQEK